MSARRRDRPLSAAGRSVGGILVIDKPSGMTSYDVIRVVKRYLRPRKIGHTGTLDPLASGVLPVVINGATRIVPFLDERVKRYEGTLRLGVVTDSDDSTGRVIEETPLHGAGPAEDRIQEVFGLFVGRIRQVPPMFSAAKHRGRPLYEFARRGIQVERRERDVEIFSLEVMRIDLPLVDFRVSCSRGTYVRALVRQIGEELGVGAHLCRLRRISSGPFTLGQALTLEEFERLAEEGGMEDRIISPREALASMPEIEIDSDLGSRISTGGRVLLRDLEGLRLPCVGRGQEVKILHKGEVLAIAKTRVSIGQKGGQMLEGPALSLLRVFA
ncbi:MAG: tRNA pseudouridine(55) synthase TruB [Deltaproteobacteria bacterium]|nr:tRNA pseudouridine(55) synthase TruB [Deltaproteobacteria bacterium]MBW2122162.1 tRNA pseudouridine(55) synthase TruB [Deltaproteobacteria bacterium]